MDVIVDGKRNVEVQGEPGDVLSVLTAAIDFLHTQGRAMVSVTVDGKPLMPDQIVEQLQGVEIDQVKVLEIGSEDKVTMVNNCVAELEISLPELPAACHSLAEVFYSETPEEGFEPFQELASLWGHIKRRQILITNALGLNQEDIVVNGISLAEMQLDLNSFLEEAARAIKDGDCVLLGDLLEYELAPRAEQESSIVAVLKEHAKAHPG
ncbi:MAG TPA: hypothetical protein PLI09_06965 [Candidatus Hydrogenedentes bacterium]|nr:hypothetical protein [Candidatus Hydrogenedentota bacterium]